MMKVAIMTDIQKMDFEERPIPQPKDDEVLVKLDYVGICGSDLHYYETGAIGDYVVKPPFVLGHEPGGVVVEVGKDVKHLQVGDRVALEPGKTCGQCEFCKEGKYNLCPDVVFFATPPVDGVFQEYVAHEANLCFKLPDNVSPLEGALIEPLAVGFHAAIQGDAHLGQKAVVMGAGCIGLVSMMALKARGVSEVYVVDVMDKRLEKAMELGATGVINGAKEDVVAKVKELTGYDMFLFRPPYGDYDNDVVKNARANHYYPIQWDVDSLDWKDYGADDIIKRVTEDSHLGNGSIILCHNGAKYTKDALDTLITTLQDKGYEFVPVSQLIYKENYYMDHEGRQIPD